MKYHYFFAINFFIPGGEILSPNDPTMKKAFDYLGVGFNMSGHGINMDTDKPLNAKQLVRIRKIIQNHMTEYFKDKPYHCTVSDGKLQK